MTLRLSLGALLSAMPGLGHLVVGPRRWAPLYLLVAGGLLTMPPSVPSVVGLMALAVGAATHVCISGLRRDMPRAERRLMEYHARAEQGRPSCPRCRRAVRTASGWCEACSSLLEESAVDVHLAPVRATNWLTRSGDSAARRHLVRRPVLSNSAGRRVVMGGIGTRVAAATERLAYPTACTTEIVAAFRDPQSSEVLWTRVRARRGDVHGDHWESLAVWAHRFDEGRLAHSWEFFPIHGGPLAATTAVDRTEGRRQRAA